MTINSNRNRVAIAIFITFLGCSINVVVLEALIREDVSSTNLITFSQFVFIALEGLLFTSKFFTQPNVVPLKHYITLVVLFFMVSVANNYALSCEIAMPLHMVFRSGSLITSMFLGIILLHKRYTTRKYAAVFMITVGIITCTWASAKQSNEKSTSSFSIYTQLIGVFLLTFALCCSALMGVFQERMAIKFGKHPKESLFFLHFLPLPFFAFLTSSLMKSVALFNQSDPVVVGFGLTIPYAWLLLALNVITQYVCIRSVFVLTTECTCLTVTLVVTLRKFTSLLFSIFYFQNPFTAMHWSGAALVFSGTLIFVDVDWLSLVKASKDNGRLSSSKVKSS